MLDRLEFFVHPHRPLPLNHLFPPPESEKAMGSLDLRHVYPISFDTLEPLYHELESQNLRPANLIGWLADWSRLAEYLSELHNRLQLATLLDTSDKDASQRLQFYFEHVFPWFQGAEQRLREKLLVSGLEPEGMEIPLRRMRLEASIYQEANIPLLTEEEVLSFQYAQLRGNQTLTWESQERTFSQMRALLQDFSPDTREKAWRLIARRKLADREAINEVWRKLLSIRLKIAQNAGYGQDYRAYRWRELKRLDYAPQDCIRFDRAVLRTVVPVAVRLSQRRRRQMGIRSSRPWMENVDPFQRAPLRPFQEALQMQAGVLTLFEGMDRQLGEYFRTMVEEGLLDLASRKDKGPGSFCIELAASRRPFIMQNAVGVQQDVQELLHECGHAFHFFEANALPTLAQRNSPVEFEEMAALAMEILGSLCLDVDHGGFYRPAEAARARQEQLENLIGSLRRVGMAEAFQHWAYENPQSAMNPKQCDAQWSALWQAFMPDQDWSGLDEEMATGWQSRLHVIEWPFYNVEYGLASLGAAQIGALAQLDLEGSLKSYREALALGGTQSLPQLYQAAGASLIFDEAAMQQTVRRLELTIQALEMTSE